MWPFIAAAVPAVASAFGQHMANKQNVRLSREGMAFEADQVAKQMQFQERMSATAYQRATEDMRLAGINPMLAYAQGGASTPGGGAASGAAATVQDVAGPAVASAQHARRLHQEMENMRGARTLMYSQQRQATSQANLNQQNADNAAIEGRLLELGVPRAENQARIDRGGRTGPAAAWLERLFGGRGALSPIGLRR